MSSLNYQLVISDFDGTLVKRNGEIGEYSKQMIARYRRDGGAFALVSGRMPSSILARAKELGLKGLLGAYQGSVVMDIESGNVLTQGKLNYPLALEACREMEQMGMHVHIYGFNKFYSNVDDEPLRLYVKATGEEPVILPNLTQFMQETGFVPYKILAMVASEDLTKYIEYFTKKYGEQCYVTASSRHFLELCCKDFSKATATKYIADYYGVSLRRTLAVGDQLNDLPMLESVGFGIAVKNCQEKLKEKVPVFAYSNEEDAVGKIIEKYAYGE